jgi:hypothetical protein
MPSPSAVLAVYLIGLKETGVILRQNFPTNFEFAYE